MKLEIIPPKAEYVDLLHQWRSESVTLKFNPVRQRTKKELEEMLLASDKTLNPLDKTKAHRWFIRFAGEVVGTVSLSEINSTMGIAEIGYMIGQSYHSRGIATAALKEWTSMIFESTDLRKLTASVAEKNLPSMRVLEKVGYQKEGFLREHYLIQNQPTNYFVFGLLRGDWA